MNRPTTTLSNLEKLIKLDNEMRTYGFKWDSFERILNHITSEVAEIRESIETHEGQQRLEEEIGDLLHLVISLALFANLDPETILHNTHTKLENRFRLLQNTALNAGYPDLNNQPTELLLTLWGKAKEREQSLK